MARGRSRHIPASWDGRPARLRRLGAAAPVARSLWVASEGPGGVVSGACCSGDCRKAARGDACRGVPSAAAVARADSHFARVVLRGFRQQPTAPAQVRSHETFWAER